MSDDVPYDDDFEEEPVDGEGADEGGEDIEKRLKALLESGQLKPEERAALAALDSGTGDAYDMALMLNNALRRLEGGPAPAPSKPVAAAGAGAAPKRELRRPSAGRSTSERSGAAPARPAAGGGATWMDWEPRRDIKREDASFTNDELYRIRRENVILLTKLERIHRVGGGGVSSAQGRARHAAAAGVNRKKQYREIGQQNAMLLKRLENVKSTMPASRARPGPPAARRPETKGQPLVQPEWQ
eukprot:m.234079 g.234079  ORF g.234079 m.234079 type:complete len:243 (+) comp19415_c0_seq1:92-820(+)